MLSEFDDRFYSESVRSLCGVDEAGRGPLAGPVVAAAVVLPRGIVIKGLRDSKKLSPKMRLTLYDEITNVAKGWSVGIVGPREIEEINILRASLAAMGEAVRGLGERFDLVLVDGRFKFPMDVPQTAIIKGDESSQQIAAASVVAKVTRDRIMQDYHEKYPQYNFFKNKGYGTREHKAAILEFGPSPIHRRTFKGVKEVLGEEG
jgi:ribonuclease HII